MGLKSIKNPRTARVAPLVVALAAATALAGCSSSGAVGKSQAASATDNTISLWLVSAGKDQPLLDAAKQFEAKHPGEQVNITFLPNSDAGKQKLTTAMAGGTPPTVFMSSGGGNLQAYVAAGKVVPVNSIMSKYPNWQKSFVPSGFGPVTINKTIYGVPLLGSEPIMVFYSKPLYKTLGLSVPTTFDQMLSNAAAIKKAGKIPFALGNSQGWPGLAWEEMLVDRIGGPGVFNRILAGDSSAWKDPAFIKANTDIQTIVKDGYFQPGYSAVDYSNGQPNALLYTNRAAMQVMLNFLVTQMQTQAPAYLKSNSLGWFAFPTVGGGTGNPNDEAGNVGQYAVVTKAATPKQKAIAADFLATEMPDPTHVQNMLQAGEVPLVANAAKAVDAPGVSSFTKFTYSLVAKAPAYQLSWDAALPASVAQTLLTNLENVFTLKETPQEFSATMAAAK